MAVMRGIEVVTLGREAYDSGKASFEQSAWKCNQCKKTAADAGLDKLKTW